MGDYIHAVAEDLAALGYVVAAPDLFWRLKPNHQAEHNEQGMTESLALGAQFDVDTGRGRRRRRVRPPGRAARGRGRPGRDRLLPRRHDRVLPRRPRRTGRGGLLLRLRRARPGGGAGADQRPDPVPLRRQRPVHPARPGGPRSRRPSRPAATPRSTSRRTPATPSTTASPPCSTAPSPPPAPGAAPRSSWPATSPCTRRPRSPDPPYPADPPPTILKTNIWPNGKWSHPRARRRRPSGAPEPALCKAGKANIRPDRYVLPGGIPKPALCQPGKRISAQTATFPYLGRLMDST